MSAQLLAPPAVWQVVRPSPLGWFGLVGDDRAITTLVFGHASADEVQLRLGSQSEVRDDELPPLLLRAADEVAAYLGGEPRDLNRIPIRVGRQTPFQSRVQAALRRVAYGETISYAALAARAGAPRAARAVGTVMSSNPLPLLVPCHRVIGSGGRLGGFSAPQGIEMKRRLLAMEAAAGWST